MFLPKHYRVFVLSLTLLAPAPEALADEGFDARPKGELTGEAPEGASPEVIPVHGDYDWINKGKYRSTAGELCCGVDDCYQVAPERVQQNSEGYALPDYNVTVPAKQVIPSEDGKYWICKVGARMRCFFAPLSGS